MGNPTLTKVLFAALIVTFVTTIMITNYSSFVIYNNSTIEEPYKSIFYNISEKYSSLETISGEASDKNLVTNIFNIGSSAISASINVFVTGLEAIGTFFNMVPVIGSILTALSIGIPAFAGLIGLLIIILTVYISMRYIQSASNKQELP
jgi:hypothetical protein